MSFRKFVSIHGHPKEVFHDSRTNLLAEERELRIGLLELEKEGRVGASSEISKDSSESSVGDSNDEIRSTT